MSKRFNIYDVARGCIVGDNGCNLVFHDGHEATLAAERRTSLLGRTFQVRPAAPDPAWRSREDAKFSSGDYLPLPWHNRNWCLETMYPGEKYSHHYAHYSLLTLDQMAYTESEEKGGLDIQTKIKPGRYLTKFFGDVLSPEEIKQWVSRFAGEFESNALKFASTADEIERVYRNGPSSCMSHPLDHYQSEVHPVRMYAAGDLAVAYIERDGRITARSLVWPAKKVHSRIYGDGGRIQPLLKAAGYFNDYDDPAASLAYRFNGAKLVRKMQDGAFIVPYIDKGGLKDCKTHLEMHSDGDLQCVVTDHATGLSAIVDDNDEWDYSCDRCNCGCNETTIVTIADDREQEWCNDCINDYALRCSRCDVLSDGATLEPVRTGYARWRHWCSGCITSESIPVITLPGGMQPSQNPSHRSHAARFVALENSRRGLPGPVRATPWSEQAAADFAVEIEGAFYDQKYVEDHPDLFLGCTARTPTNPAPEQETF